MPNQRFPKRLRLRKRPEFRAVQRRGRRYHCELFVLVWIQGSHSWTRLGITASRKVGNAVRRNRAKRLIREAFRLNQSALPTGLDLVVIAKSAITTVKRDVVVAELLAWAGIEAERRKGADRVNTSQK